MKEKEIDLGVLSIFDQHYNYNAYIFSKNDIKQADLYLKGSPNIGTCIRIQIEYKMSRNCFISYLIPL